MNQNIIICLTICAISVYSQAQINKDGDADLKTEKEKLVKFLYEFEQQKASTGNVPETATTLLDNVQRILKEIEKISQALGYIREKPEQSKVPPILSSSQYLFIKPVMQPFLHRHHQFFGYIRSNRLGKHNFSSHSSLVFNKFDISKKYIIKKNQIKNYELIFRLNGVVIPASHNIYKNHQGPTNHIIPLRLNKLNEKEFIHENMPKKYYVKGYKIVDYVDNFLGRAKQNVHYKNGLYANPGLEFNLFFLPLVVVLKEASKNWDLSEYEANQKLGNIKSREKKAIGIQRPYKIQTIATSGSSGGGSSSNVTTQLIRKHIISKPLREIGPNISELTKQQLPLVAGSTMIAKTNMSSNSNTNTNTKLIVNNSPQYNFNSSTLRSALNIQNIASSFTRPSDTKNATASNVKSALQKIFHIPFRQENKEHIVSDGQMSQISPSIIFQAYQPTQPLNTYGSAIPQKEIDNHWEHEKINSGAGYSSEEHMEKQIFGHGQNVDQQKQMEAFKQGGIIIQRLKVRKGGIAIAGPGGVATAGSGGTAIVGPGGYALTHPRSLTIAGIGAKVIAIPSSVDLKEALQRTNLNDKTFPREGKLVATGPTVYYSPAANTEFMLKANCP